MRLRDPLGHILWGTRVILLTLSLPNRTVVLAQLFLAKVCRQVDRIRKSFPRTWILLSMPEQSEFKQDVLWCLSSKRETPCPGHMMS